MIPEQPKFTPGPLNFHKSYYPPDGTVTECDNFSAITISIAKGDKLLGEASAWFLKEGYEGGHPRVNDREEAEANARLWIASPELFGALRGMLELATIALKAAPSDCMNADWRDGILAEARAALAKAVQQ